MTLDGITDAVHAGLEVSRWSLLYYASYVLLASFVLVNVLIGVVLTPSRKPAPWNRNLHRRRPARHPPGQAAGAARACHHRPPRPERPRTRARRHIGALTRCGPARPVRSRHT